MKLKLQHFFLAEQVKEIIKPHLGSGCEDPTSDQLLQLLDAISDEMAVSDVADEHLIVEIAQQNVEGLTITVEGIDNSDLRTLLALATRKKNG